MRKIFKLLIILSLSYASASVAHNFKICENTIDAISNQTVAHMELDFDTIYPNH
jgi:hypothetical protein